MNKLYKSMSLAECYNYSLDTKKIKIINLIEYTFKLIKLLQLHYNNLQLYNF